MMVPSGAVCLGPGRRRRRRRTSAADANSSKWAQLPSDLLVLILQRLRVVDHIRFSAVCTPWNSLVKSKSCRPAPQIPWLMCPAGHRGGGHYRRSLIDMSTDEIHTMHLPELRGRQCIGTSADGCWVVFVRKDMGLGVVNIFTREQPAPLPPLTTLWDFDGPVDQEAGRWRWYDVRLSFAPGTRVRVTAQDLLRRFYRKAVVFQVGGTPVVALVHGLNPTVSVARPGDEVWVLLDGCPQGVMDVVFHGVRLYAVLKDAETVAWDLLPPSSSSSSSSSNSRRPPSSSGVAHISWSEAKSLGSPTPSTVSQCKKYLVPVIPAASQSDGVGRDVGSVVLFQVWRYTVFVFLSELPKVVGYRTKEVKVLRLDPATDAWVEAKDLGGYTFFLGHNHSLALALPAAQPASQGGRLRSDSIYFTDDNMYGIQRNKDSRRGDRDLGVFSLETGSWDALPLPAGAISVNYPPPVWVTFAPSFD